jgi:hypothetical protein
MNQEISYQNREIGEINPLNVIEEQVSPASPIVTKKPLNSKTKLLLILGVFIFVLLIVSLVISLAKNSLRTVPATKNTVTPTSVQTPTNVPSSVIPTEFQEKFTQIDQYNQSTVNFNPPQIDTTIGQ